MVPREPHKAIGIVTVHAKMANHGVAMDMPLKAAQLGIQTSFIDAAGKHRSISQSALEMLVQSVPDKLSHSLLTEPLICRDGAFAHVDIPEHTSLPVKWEMLDISQKKIAEGVANERVLTLPVLSPGVHRLRLIDAAGEKDEVNLLCVPARAFAGDFGRAWILAIQLYGVRSPHNWGIGDFSDLESIIEWAAQAGAAGVGLNPLHALFDDRPQDCSPYSPNSRLFLNPQYIDVTRLPELGSEFVNHHAEAIERAKSEEFVDYVRIAALKLEALGRAFEVFRLRSTLRRRTIFEEFRRERGVTLRRFSAFEILRRKHTSAWWDWPDKWSSPNDLAIDELRLGTDSHKIEFVEFVQWCAHEQLKACTELAIQLKMPVGLYLDVAVGVKADGFDAWNEQVAISRRLSVGAPPDLLNTAGQNWGLAGFNASGLEERSYQPFRDMLSASMKYSGAIRLDHVLGLQRLYLVPTGYLPDEGAYVQMPFEALLALTALESMHHRCVVIGEDLGTVPDGFRERLSNWGIWSYRVMMFERNYEGIFHPIDHYPEESMVTFNTHDLPTFAGWQSGHDIALKLSLGIDPGESLEARTQASKMLQNALTAAQLGDGSLYSALGYLAQTKARILSISLEDLLGIEDQPNIPGTIDEHPNWRRRLPASFELLTQKIDFVRLRDVIQREAKNKT